MAIEAGFSYSEAARAAGRRSNDAVSHWVSRLNRMGMPALNLQHGGWDPIQYGASEQRKILERFRIPPDKKIDRTATWSLNTLQAALKSRDHLDVSTFVIWKTLGENGYAWQRNRTWVDTGKTVRMRKDGSVEVEDMDRVAKKNLSRRHTRKRVSWAEIYGVKMRLAPFKQSHNLAIAGNESPIQPESRGGTTKILTLFHPQNGKIRAKGVESSTHAIIHPWMRKQLADILKHTSLTRQQKLQEHMSKKKRNAIWERWQEGLQIKFTLPEQLPPLRILLILDHLSGHKTPEMVFWWVYHGIMPIYTPMSGSGLNMAESIQNLLKARALTGTTPKSSRDLIESFEQVAQAWNRNPTPFVWGGKRATRRQRSRERQHSLSGSGATTQ